jgi:hypothetical protein
MLAISGEQHSKRQADKAKDKNYTKIVEETSSYFRVSLQAMVSHFKNQIHLRW